MSKSNSLHSEQNSFLEKDENSITAGIVDENSPQEANIINQSNPATIAQKEMEKYISENKELYGSLIQFLNDSDNNENSFQDLINIICQQRREENREQFEKLLQLITNVSNNYHREKSFFEKIFQILEHYEVQIKQTFSNKEIFDIFQSNKKILLFLFQKEIIRIDENIYNELQYKIERNGNRYCHFFYPEIKKFIGEEKSKDIHKELISINSDIFDRFEEKRQEGENDSFICSLIREDSVEKFVEYVNRTNISLKSEVKSSIFETNSFLIENKNTSLIEYSAFYGSIQIFQYLRLNNAELKPSLWLYAIHSRNAELIHLLESLKVDPPNNEYKTCLCESIKCHHNEISDYIENNFINDDKTRKSEEVILSILSFHNYAYFPSFFEESDEFYYLCSNNYHKLVNLFIEMKKDYIEQMISKRTNNFFTKESTLQEIANENKVDIIYYFLLTYNCVHQRCFDFNEKIRKIAIPSSVTSIEEDAFSGCSSLTQITIPSSVTSIGRGAFYGCISLIQITIPSSVTLIKDVAFFKCSSLTQITIPLSITSIGDYAFKGCSSLTQVTISSSVTSIGNCAFEECTSLTQITIPSSVTSIRNSVFCRCSSLTQIAIPSSVTSIRNYAFFGCSSLTQIIIPSSVTSIGKYAFSYCSSLKEITIPSSVTSIGDYAFNDCSSLAQVTIPSSVTSIGEDAFPSKSRIIRI